MTGRQCAREKYPATNYKQEERDGSQDEQQQSICKQVMAFEPASNTSKVCVTIAMYGCTVRK